MNSHNQTSAKFLKLCRRLRQALSAPSGRWTLAALCLALVGALCLRGDDAARAAAPPPQSNSPDGVWEGLEETTLRADALEPQRAPAQYRTVRLNQAALKRLLDRAPLEAVNAAPTGSVELTLPLPDGSFARFHIEESPIMHPELAAQFPEIKTYQARGIDDPTAFARFDLTPHGFNALILRGGHDVQIAPRARGNATDHLSYYLKDTAAEPTLPMSCGAAEAETLRETIRRVDRQAARDDEVEKITNGATLRRYDLAVAATDAWTNAYGGGTVAGALTAINTVVNQVNAIYQRELSVRLDLIANNNLIIYTTANPSGGPGRPYSDNNGNNATGMTNAENEANLNAVIGAANYDIGHLFGVQNAGATSAGLARVASVCGGDRARGSSMFTGGLTTNPFNLYVVAHEVGHQFGARHTFNDSCNSNRNAGTAWEPGTGSTIMSYGSNNCAGSTGLQARADMYFHSGSLIQMINHLNGGGGGCATGTASGNNSPTLSAEPNFTIPRSTPFRLTATGSDPDGHALTFGWEQFDTGGQSPPNTDDGSRPLFRSFPPTADGAERTFPSLPFILNNANNPPTTVGGFTTGESLPTTNRTMTFQIVARDNQADGAVNTATTQITVAAGSGPFAVTQPNAALEWVVGATRTVTWDVAGSAGAPVSCANVRLLLSTDGGNTFPVVLSANTANDGAENIVVPNAVTPQARVKVEAVGNIFFDISDNNFTIQPSADLQLLSKVDAPDPVVTGSLLTYTITVRNNGPNAATDAVVTDNLPVGALFNSCAATGGGVCGGAGQNREVTFATLAAGATEIITLTATANCGLSDGAVINNATAISSATFDPNPGNNSGAAATVAQNPPPVITCPADFDATAATPGSTTAIVNFADPLVTDNCPGATVVCTPASGSAFPLGATTVNCTATDSGGATASCSFAVTVWDVIIQDDENRDYILFNSFTGDYKFVHCGVDGFEMVGRGVVTRVGCITKLRDDTRVVGAAFDRCHVAPRNVGGAKIKRRQPDTTFVINDRDILNNAPTCP